MAATMYYYYPVNSSKLISEGSNLSLLNNTMESQMNAQRLQEKSYVDQEKTITYHKGTCAPETNSYYSDQLMNSKDQYNEIPEYQTQWVIKEIEVPTKVNIPMMQPRQIPIEQKIQRNIPVLYNVSTVYPFEVPQIKPKYVEIQVPIYVPRYIEIPIFATKEIENPKNIKNSSSNSVRSVSNPPSLLQINALDEFKKISSDKQPDENLKISSDNTKISDEDLDHKNKSFFESTEKHQTFEKKSVEDVLSDFENDP